jgi:4-hydroxy-2-oxoglutarate aldolase
MRDRLHGIFPPIPTPFDASDRIDRKALTRNVGQWMQTGLSGLLAVGSNGEAPFLDQDECDEVIATVREAMPGRVLLAGTGHETTKRAIVASARAARNGADAVLVRAPSYYKTQMTTDALVAHFTAVADASPVPVLLYNLPGATGITLTMPVVGKLAGHPNIAGLKETSPELDRLGQFTQLQAGAFRVFCGWAPVVYPALVAGAVGGILAIANVLPEECVALYEHVRAGRHAEALALQRRLTPLAQLVSTIHGIAGLKAALEMVDFVGGPVRGPLLPVPPRAREEIAAALTAAKLVGRRP